MAHTKIVEGLLILSLIGCSKKAAQQLKYDMLVATHNQIHVEMKDMETDKNIIARKCKESHEKDSSAASVVSTCGM